MLHMAHGLLCQSMGHAFIMLKPFVTFDLVYAKF